jgi:hypothetical protein
LGTLDRGEKVYLNEAAAHRVFLPDLPEEVHARRDVRHKSTKTAGPSANRKKFDKKLDKG